MQRFRERMMRMTMRMKLRPMVLAHMSACSLCTSPDSSLVTHETFLSISHRDILLSHFQ